MNATSLLSLTLLAIGQGNAPAEFYQDLRNRQPLLPDVALTGPYLGKYTFRDKEGLRVLLPPKREKPGPIGLQTNFPIKGDFEITGSYEILAVDQPTKVNTIAGVNIWIRQGNDDNRFARIGRFHSRNQGHAYVLQHTDRSLPKATTIKNIATDVKSGQIRFVRREKTLFYLVRDETTDGEFKELFKTEFGDDDVSLVRFVVNTGDEFYAIESRLIDLRIKGSGGVPNAAPQQQAVEPDATPAHPRRWTYIAIGIGLGVLVLFAGVVGIGVYFRSKREPS